LGLRIKAAWAQKNRFIYNNKVYRSKLTQKLIIVIAIVGNKIDLIDKEQVTWDEAKAYSRV